jgi:hypothetical protein
MTDTWTITFQDNFDLNAFLREVKHWYIPSSHFSVDGLVVKTGKADVVDVAYETFIKRPDSIKVEKK